MGPKNGHMTQEVLIRAFPGFTHAQRKKQFSFYQGCKAGEDAHGSGWPCMLKHTGWRQVRPGSEREGAPCGSARGGREARCQERPGPRHPQSALLTVAALRCLAWGLLCKTHSSVRLDMSFLSPRVQTLGHTWCSMNIYLLNEGWRMSEQMSMRTKGITQRKPSFPCV